MPKQQAYDHLIKLLIVGDSGIGKTNMLLRFCDNSFLTSHITTIGIDFKTKTLQIDGKRIRMQIWDTAGQQRFKTITQTYYRGSMGIFLTYSISDRQSFNNIVSWHKQIKLHSSSDVVILLIGNKTDCKRQVSYQEGQKLGQQLGLLFMQTSAKDNIGIQQCFNTMGKMVKDQFCMDNQISILSYTGSKLHKRSDNQLKKKKCC